MYSLKITLLDSHTPQIDFNPTIPMKISSKYLIGVGKVSDRLVIIMNLCEILGSEVYDNVRNSKLAKLA